jgi:hypothetical protein
LGNLIGPSPIQSLLRDFLNVVAKFSAQATKLFYKRNDIHTRLRINPPATSPDKSALAMRAVETNRNLPQPKHGKGYLIEVATLCVTLIEVFRKLNDSLMGTLCYICS